MVVVSSYAEAVLTATTGSIKRTAVQGPSDKLFREVQTSWVPAGSIVEGRGCGDNTLVFVAAGIAWQMLKNVRGHGTQQHRGDTRKIFNFKRVQNRRPLE